MPRPAFTISDLPLRIYIDENGCWIWQGTKFQSSGYGRLKVGGREYVAHRFVYEALKGLVPAGRQLDHLCRVRACVNPDHLEPVTARENQKRGTSPISYLIDAVECREGHPFSGNNLFVRRDGRRLCRTCKNRGQRQRAKTEIYREKHADYERNRRRKVKELTDANV